MHDFTKFQTFGSLRICKLSSQDFSAFIQFNNNNNNNNNNKSFLAPISILKAWIHCRFYDFKQLKNGYLHIQKLSCFCWVKSIFYIKMWCRSFQNRRTANLVLCIIFNFNFSRTYCQEPFFKIFIWLTCSITLCNTCFLFQISMVYNYVAVFLYIRI